MILLVLIIILSSFSLHAQMAGNISGQVIDWPFNQVVSGVNVTIEDANSNILASGINRYPW